MAKEVGLKEAFLEFAADSAVLNRNGKILKGKQQIATYFDSQTLQNVSLEWKPEFVEVAKAGDMAYTYGPFTFSAISGEGEPKTVLGYFHTVWKKQEDGGWKFIYDRSFVVTNKFLKFYVLISKLFLITIPIKKRGKR